MKKVIKLVAGIVFGFVVAASFNVEAKADAASDAAAIQQYLNEYAAYVNYANQMQVAAAYLSNQDNLYKDPATYYAYANFLTDGSFGIENGSQAQFVAAVEKEKELYYTRMQIIAQNEVYVAAIYDLADVYAIGESYKAFSGGVNPYAAAFNSALNDYEKWWSSVSKYF